MTRSDAIDQLAAALSKAQGRMGAARRDAENPHFRSSYASMASIVEAARDALAANDLAFVQSPRLVHGGGDLWLCELEGLLMHGTSGQWIADAFSLPIGALTAQSVGSAVSYARRYQLQSLLGLAAADLDDDGEAAAAPSAPRPKARKAATSATPGAVPDRASPPPRVTEIARGRVTSIVKRPLKSGKEKYIIKLRDDGREFESWSSTTATTAKEAQQADREVELLVAPTRFGLQILTLRDPHEPEPPL
jgi:hypothetical protein